MTTDNPRSRSELIQDPPSRLAHQALHLSLAAIATSQLRERFALRGSLALEYLFGSRARTAGDLDFILVKQQTQLVPQERDRLLDEVVYVIRSRLRLAGIFIEPDQVIISDIGDYRIEGEARRIHFLGRDGFIGPFHVDLAFDEAISDDPARLILGEYFANLGLPIAEGANVLMASIEEMFAWKVKWLEDDACFGRIDGKDVYDASLLLDLIDPAKLPAIVSSSHGPVSNFSSDMICAELSEPENIDWTACKGSIPLTVEELDTHRERLAKVLSMP